MVTSTSSKSVDPSDGHSGNGGASHDSVLPVPVERAAVSGELAGPYGMAGAMMPVLPVRVRRWSFRLLLRYKWTTVIVFALLVGVSVPWIWLKVKPEYRATAEVRIRPIIPALVFRTEDNGMIPLYQSYLNTQVSVMRSPTVIQRVLEQPAVQQTLWYKNPPRPAFGNMPSPVERLRDNLTISPRGNTELVDVSLAALDPHEAALIVNALLEQYVKYVGETSDQSVDLLYRKLMDEHNALRDEIEGREKVVAGLRKELGTSDPDELVSQRRIRLDQIEAQLAVLRRDQATTSWQQKELENLVKGRLTAGSQPSTGPGVEPSDLARFQDDMEWRRLYFEWRTAQRDVEDGRQRYTDAHEMTGELARRVKFAEDMLRGREAQLRDQARTHPFASTGPAEGGMTLERELDVAGRRIKLLKYQEQLLTEEATSQRASWERAFDAAQILARENEAIRRRREVYTAVRTRLDQKDVERNVPGSIEVLTRALTPSQPDGDKRIMLTSIAVVLSLGVSLGVALARGGINPPVYTAVDFAQAVHTPMLGELPLIRGKPLDMEDDPILAESIRQVRTSLLRSLGSHKGSAVLITSAGPGAGKTTVAAMLARSLAQCGKRVLLIDGDLRNPSLSKMLGIKSDLGFTAALAWQASDAQTIVDTETPCLSVLPAGREGEEFDPELITKGAYADCMLRWRLRYDIILLDSPPVLPVADARILARQTDGVIMVVREAHCRLTEILGAMEQLGSEDKLMTTVFIGSRLRKAYSYYTRGSSGGRK